MRRSSENGVTQLPRLSSRISNHAPDLCLQLCPLPAFPLSVTRPQAVPLSRVLSQMRLFSLAPYFRRTVALTCSAPLREGLTDQWPNEQGPNVGHSQERLLGPAAAGALRLRPGATRPRKSLRDGVAAAFQGLWKITTYIWHQASPSTTLPQHQRMWLPSGVCWKQVASIVSTKCPSSSGTAFPVGPRTSRTPLCSWGFAFPIRALPGIEMGSCSL